MKVAELAAQVYRSSLAIMLSGAILAGLLIAGAACAASAPREAGSSVAKVRAESAPPSATPARASADPAASEPATKTDHDDPPPAAELRALVVPGHQPALVYVPPTTAKRPLVVATHGAGGAPEYECEYWRELTAGRAFVLCLRGTPLDVRSPSSFYYKDHHALGREFRAAMTAFNAEYGARVSASGGVYAGFSQGAIMGAPMIVPHARSFARLALIEGGYEYWSQSGARAFARAGGKRVLFSCGTRWCKDKAELPAAWLRKAGVEVRVEYAEGAGHTPGGEVMARTATALPWLFEGDPAWNP